MDAGGRDLGQQWLEDEIIIGVNELDIELAAAVLLQSLRGEHAAEAAAEHQHLLFLHGSPAFLQGANTYANAALRQVTRMKQEATISPWVAEERSDRSPKNICPKFKNLDLPQGELRRFKPQVGQAGRVEGLYRP